MDKPSAHIGRLRVRITYITSQLVDVFAHQDAKLGSSFSNNEENSLGAVEIVNDERREYWTPRQAREMAALLVRAADEADKKPVDVAAE